MVRSTLATIYIVLDAIALTASLKLSPNGTLLYRYATQSLLQISPRVVTLDAAGNLLVGQTHGDNRIVTFVNPFCPTAHYCPFRTPILCPAGYYCPSPQYVHSVAAPIHPAVSCRPLLSQRHGRAAELCPERHFCRPGTIDPLPCPAGYYCPAGSDDPTSPHCQIDQLDRVTATGCALICPLGSYCPAMSATHILCPAVHIWRPARPHHRRMLRPLSCWHVLECTRPLVCQLQRCVHTRPVLSTVRHPAAAVSWRLVLSHHHHTAVVSARPLRCRAESDTAYMLRAHAMPASCALLTASRHVRCRARQDSTTTARGVASVTRVQLAAMQSRV